MVDRFKAADFLLKQAAKADGTVRKIQGNKATASALVEILHASREKNQEISEDTVLMLKKWRADKVKRLDNIRHLYEVMARNQEQWGVPEKMLNVLWAFNELLSWYLFKEAAVAFRRNVWGNAVRFCTRDVKYWMLERYTAGVISLNEVNSVGFFVDSDQIPKRTRHMETLKMPDIHVTNHGLDCVSVKVSSRVVKTSSRIGHYWPFDVNFAIIRIMTEEGKVIIERITSRQNTLLFIPGEYRGKILLAKAAYLVHTDDVPKFPTTTIIFSTPYGTEDIPKHFKEEISAKEGISAEEGNFDGQ